jgi:hypothetical protein
MYLIVKRRRVTVRQTGPEEMDFFFTLVTRLRGDRLLLYSRCREKTKSGRSGGQFALRNESEEKFHLISGVLLPAGPARSAPFALHLGPVTRIRDKKNKSPLSRPQAVVCCAVSKGCTGHTCRVG